MTFKQIRDRVFLGLDTSTEIDGDLKTHVDFALEDIYTEVITETRPDELLTSATATIAAGIDTVAIGSGGFEITDFDKELALKINGLEDPWINRDYRSWLRADDDRNSLWTVHNSNIIFRPAPATGQTYAAELLYYKIPATITDAGVPEIPRHAHQALVWGTLTKFPHIFQGETQQIKLLKYEKDFEKAVADLKRNRAGAQKLRSLHPRRKVASLGNLTFAGS